MVENKKSRLCSDEKEHADGRQVDDPGGDGHHGFRQTCEEVDEGLALVLHDGQGDAQDHREEDQTQDVGSASVLAADLPRVQVVRYPNLAVSLGQVRVAGILQDRPVLLDACL